MIFNAIVLATVTYIGMVLIFIKLPNVVRKVMLKGDLITDIGCCAVTYMFLGGTATAIIAAGIVGIMVSASLAYVKSPQCQNIDERTLKKT